MMIFALIFVSVLLLICLVIFAFDFVPSLLTWLKRIHIGRYTDEKSWRENVEKTALAQIKKMPPIPISDATAYTVFPKLRGKYYNFYFVSWQVAVLLRALGDNEQARKAAYSFFEKEDWYDRSYKTGAGMLFYAMLENGFADDEKFRAAADDYCKKALAAAGDGTLPYHLEYADHYVDTLGMVCPFLIKYHQTYGCPEALALAKRQFEEYFAHGLHPQTGLPIHCFNPESKMPLGLYGWGRGCGWLALALNECIYLLDGKDEYVKILKERAEQFADIMAAAQNTNGGFNSIIGVPSSREDSSATAMLGGLFARLGGKYTKNADACVEYLMSVTRKNGEIDFAQGDTMGIGNYSRRFEPMPAAQGFALMIGK